MTNPSLFDPLQTPYRRVRTYVFRSNFMNSYVRKNIIFLHDECKYSHNYRYFQRMLSICYRYFHQTLQKKSSQLTENVKGQQFRLCSLNYKPQTWVKTVKKAIFIATNL